MPCVSLGFEKNAVEARWTSLFATFRPFWFVSSPLLNLVKKLFLSSIVFLNKLSFGWQKPLNKTWLRKVHYLDINARMKGSWLTEHHGRQPSLRLCVSVAYPRLWSSAFLSLFSPAAVISLVSTNQAKCLISTACLKINVSSKNFDRSLQQSREFCEHR